MQLARPWHLEKCWKLQAEFDLSTTREEEHLWLKSEQRCFEMGDRASELLAQQAQAAAASRLISRMKSPQGDIFTDPRQQRWCFRCILLCTAFLSSPHDFRGEQWATKFNEIPKNEWWPKVIL